MKQTLISALAGALAAVAVGGGIAWASVPSSSGVIQACYSKSTGVVSVIDTDAGQTCNERSQVPLSWNRQGRDGIDGTNGKDGVSVTSSALGVGDANCPTGGSEFVSSNATTYACNGAKGDTGDQGPPGPKGDPGPSLSSLAGIPCDSGTIDKPDSTTKVDVDAATGALTLTCVSPNPDLSVKIEGRIGCGVFGCEQFEVQQVDATGDPVSGGFQCGQSGPLSCDTQRFAAGTTVHLQAVNSDLIAAGVDPVWSFCDSVDATGTICTVTMSDDRFVDLGSTA
jgi:hypothetical protein